MNAGNGSLSPVGFLRAYPSRDLAVNLPVLQGAVNQISSLSVVVSTVLATDLGGNLGKPDNSDGSGATSPRAQRSP
ncbi:hypothetical protein [Vulcanococcus limneticus]|uniref:hypothetical protein n=1 Tax=Vulcanococcus limneticus TaxID=2170428 RepID=UPI00398C05BB